MKPQKEIVLMKKCEQLAETIRQRIKTNQYKEKLPTERELMEESGMSRVTVRKAIAILQQDIPLRRSKKGGTYISNPQVDTINRQLVILMPDSSPESIEIITGVENYFSSDNISITVKFTNLSVKSERAILEELLKLNVAGFLIYPATTSTNRDIFLRIAERNIPLVFIDRSPFHMICSSVSINNQQIAIDAVNYLYEQGHRQIAFFASGLKSQQSTVERLWGYSYAMSRHHLPVTKDHIFALQNIDEMHQCFERFFNIENRATAVFCSDDVLAGFFICAAQERGYRVPEDFSVIGVDNKDNVNTGGVALTTVCQPYRELGRQAAQIMDSILSDNNRGMTKLYLPAEMILRDSVRKIN